MVDRFVVTGQMQPGLTDVLGRQAAIRSAREGRQAREAAGGAKVREVAERVRRERQQRGEAGRAAIGEAAERVRRARAARGIGIFPAGEVAPGGPAGGVIPNAVGGAVHPSDMRRPGNRPAPARAGGNRAGDFIGGSATGSIPDTGAGSPLPAVVGPGAARHEAAVARQALGAVNALGQGSFSGPGLVPILNEVVQKLERLKAQQDKQDADLKVLRAGVK